MRVEIVTKDMFDAALGHNAGLVMLVLSDLYSHALLSTRIATRDQAITGARRALAGPFQQSPVHGWPKNSAGSRDEYIGFGSKIAKIMDGEDSRVVASAILSVFANMIARGFSKKQIVEGIERSVRTWTPHQTPTGINGVR